ncbi:MAG: LLM class flavin-dependent oxidoreductase [Acetobacteraceae bacterium]|nr:LLM class flavin-dependent oxidoreductase [Acetobacteraceae bacterium]MSP31151.1 LLM class flavin-dependent oxidoreductase [Acetobacteraceae bacterium]
MKVGVMLNTQFEDGVSIHAQLPNLLAQVRTARESGYASVWFPDHYIIGPVRMPQPVPLMAYLLHETGDMMIGPNIRILALLNPVQAAEEAATMDILSGGKYIFGVGLGYREPEFSAFNVPINERAARFSECIGVMRRLWTEQKVDHHGKYYTVDNAAISAVPHTPGGPPVYVAALAEPAIKRAARIGDAWLAVNTTDIKTTQRHMATYRAALAEYGRTPREFPLTRECYIGSSYKTAFEECRAALHYKYTAYAAWGASRPVTDQDAFGMSFENFCKDRFIIGDKVSVKEAVAKYTELLGVDHFIMRQQWPGLSQERVLHSIRSVGEIFA